MLFAHCGARSIEDAFVLLLFYTVSKLALSMLRWAFGFGWKGPLVFLATFIVGPIPTSAETTPSRLVSLAGHASVANRRKSIVRYLSALA